ncbi:endothelin-converting enzyme homolog isoform X1 [Montipora foliosa]|uniref:endothelin-converting enzyme homolog isoform X1 n=1 Tax=Montipora foliosa TaxID=591990 RepID=UPI0035F133D0
MEMNLVPSKQSLVVYSSRGRETNWSSRRRAEMCLLSLCGILLLTCIVLAALFGMDLSKTGTDKYGLSTSPPTPTTRASEPRVCNTATCLETAARLTRNMNESVDPCEDFFHFACDGWIRDNPIPPSENEYITFIKKIQANNEKLRNMLEDAIGDYEDPIMKAKRYYRSCMDENEVERTTKDQVLELIRSFGSCALQGEDWAMSRWNWKTALLKIQKTFLHSAPLFTIDVSTNPRNSKKHIVMIKLPELSLIREEYLARNDSKVDKKKNAYLDYMTSVAMLIGGHNDAIQMHLHSVLEFEGKLAQSMPSTAYLYENLHNAITIADLQQLAPQFQWLDYLNSLFAEYSISLKKSQKIIVPAPEYLKKMAEVVLSTNNSTLSDYFIWTVLRRLVPFLSRPFRDVEAKYKRIASHIKGESPRWLTCIKAVNYHRGLGFATGSLYVEKAFDEKMIPLVKEMMENIRTAFREEVANLVWIDDETRPKVYEKEEAIVEKIGYPEMCVNKTSLAGYYQDLKVDNKRFLLNEVNVSRWYSSKSLAKLGRPSLRGRWFNGPQSVNAYYKWEKNEINILAGILQPPFYYGRLAPRVVNFGAIGVVLAHELTHGFDSVGRKFNKYGEISKPWWSSYTLDGFQNRSECLVDQYNKYSLDIEGKRIFINGRQTLFENIADNGAVKIAHRAYKNWARKHGSDAMVPGMKRSNDQIFFLTYAQMWCSNFSPSQIFRRAKTDTHTLPIYRVNGVLSNMEEFAKAYNCPRDSKLNPKKRCRVW